MSEIWTFKEVEALSDCMILDREPRAMKLGSYLVSREVYAAIPVAAPMRRNHSRTCSSCLGYTFGRSIMNFHPARRKQKKVQLIEN